MIIKRQEAVTRMEQSGRMWKKYHQDAQEAVNKKIRGAKAFPVELDLTFTEGLDEAVRLTLREEILRELKDGGYRIRRSDEDVKADRHDKYIIE